MVSTCMTMNSVAAAATATSVVAAPTAAATLDRASGLVARADRSVPADSVAAPAAAVLVDVGGGGVETYASRC